MRAAQAQLARAGVQLVQEVLLEAALGRAGLAQPRGQRLAIARDAAQEVGELRRRAVECMRRAYVLSRQTAHALAERAVGEQAPEGRLDRRLFTHIGSDL